MSINAKELAQKLGLSAAAVSMALNKKAGVSSETRQRVLAAAKELGYDFTKLSLKKQIDGSIYFIIYKKHGTVVTDTPFFSQLSEGIRAGSKQAGYNINVRYLYDDDGTLDKQVAKIPYSDCCGVLLLGTEMSAKDYHPFAKLPLPVVVLDNYFEDVAANYVLINNVQGACLAVSHLIKHCGCQPGYLRSSCPIGNFEERAAGFYRALQTAGFPASQSVVHRLTPTVDGACADMLELLLHKEKLAGCYFADNDLIAVGAMKAFKSQGLRIPEDIAIIGFDNIAFSNVVEPGLTTIHVPKQDLGRLAVSRLVTILEDGDPTLTKIEVATQLIKRRST